MTDEKLISFSKDDALAGMSDEEKGAQLGPMMGVAAIALNMAMKYHDFATVQDGALYQQFKLEGRNMSTINLEEVLRTATIIEKHLIDANGRVAKLFVAAALTDEELVEGDESVSQSGESSGSDAP